MTTFAEHQHPRTGNGRFTTKDHAEAELELRTPAVNLVEATGDWGPRFHDVDARPAYEYALTERAAAAFRFQYPWRRGFSLHVCGVEVTWRIGNCRFVRIGR